MRQVHRTQTITRRHSGSRQLYAGAGSEVPLALQLCKPRSFRIGAGPFLRPPSCRTNSPALPICLILNPGNSVANLRERIVEVPHERRLRRWGMHRPCCPPAACQHTAHHHAARSPDRCRGPTSISNFAGTPLASDHITSEHHVRMCLIYESTVRSNRGSPAHVFDFKRATISCS
jgi:hypothetical protein